MQNSMPHWQNCVMTPSPRKNASKLTGARANWGSAEAERRVVSATACRISPWKLAKKRLVSFNQGFPPPHFPVFFKNLAPIFKDPRQNPHRAAHGSSTKHRQT